MKKAKIISSSFVRGRISKDIEREYQKNYQLKLKINE